MSGFDRHGESLKFAVDVLSFKYQDYISSIYLYGSYARGTHSYNSDIDLLIYVNRVLSGHEIRKMRTDVISDDYKLPEVELKILLDGTFMGIEQFRNNIERDKVLVWEKN